MKDEAKNALDTIKILQEHDTYNETDGIGIINNLMKRAVADYKQYLLDQQEGAIEMWRLVDSSGHVMPSDHNSPGEANQWRDELQESNPQLDFSDSKPKLFREVMDNE